MYKKGNLRKKVAATAIVTAVLITSICRTNEVSAVTVTTSKWNLVDSGKHLDYDEDTNYLVYFSDAVSVWNAYKKGVIRKDAWNVIEDVYVSDYSGDNTTVVKISSNGTIKFNQMVMDKLDDYQKQNACEYAIGCALGLGATSNGVDVMYKNVSRRTVLSVNDKASYDAAYKKY